MSLSVDDTQYQRAAAQLRAAGPELRKEWSRALRVAVRPFARDVLITGAARMPRRGGLSFHLSRSRPRILASGLRCEVIFGGGYAKGLGGIEEQGIVKHPVFEQRATRQERRDMRRAGIREIRAPFISQHVPAHVFRGPFEAGAPRMRDAVLAVTQQYMARLEETR